MKLLAASVIFIAFSAQALPVVSNPAPAIQRHNGQNLVKAKSLFGPEDEGSTTYPQPDGPKEPTAPSNDPIILPNVDPLPGDTERLINKNPPPRHPVRPPAPGQLPVPQPMPMPMPPAPSAPATPFSGVQPLDEVIGVHHIREEMEKRGVSDDQAYFIKASAPQVFIHINKATQTIQIWAPETAGLPGGSIVRLVSTGGGLKHPVDPQTQKPDKPYCADYETPNVTNLWIPAIEGQTMFKGKTSNRFLTAKGDGVAMPNAIHVRGGIYLHEVPSGRNADGVLYSDLLGYNVSGGCIRLDAELSQWLWDEMLAYGGAELTIYGDNPGQPQCYVDQYGVARAAGQKPASPAVRPQPRQEAQPPLLERRVRPRDPVTRFFDRLFGA